MYETSTRWEDTGYDCEHCGGQLFRRVDQLPHRPSQTYYQCHQCDCQWSLDWELLRPGVMPRCDPQAERVPMNFMSFSLVRAYLGPLIIALVGLLLLVRFVGPLLGRYLLPLLILVVISYGIIRLGQQRRWW